MRLATVITDGGLRLHVRGRSGYVDVANATGDDRLSDLTAVLSGGPEVLELVQRAAEEEGRGLTEAEYGPAVPSPRRILCFGVNYVEHALEGGRPPTKWPEVFVRGDGPIRGHRLLRGPGRVLIQSMTLEKMRRELAPARAGGDEHRGLGAITDIFSNED